MRKARDVTALIARLDEKGLIPFERFHSEADTQAIVLFNLEKAAQDCLDLAAHVISDQSWEMPEHYKDLFPVLEHKDLITKDLSEFMQELAGFRNVLVHRYGALSYEKAYRFYLERERLKEFCAAVLRHFQVLT